MVLWELTVPTAYFLGLKRTYSLALSLLRRLVGPNHPNIRQFLYRRTRSVFDMAVKVHKNVQERDLELGRSIGSRILRWLDHMKPSAHIRPPKSIQDTSTNRNKAKHMMNSAEPRQISRLDIKTKEQESNSRLNFTSLMNMQKKFTPMTTTIIQQPMRPANVSDQYRRISYKMPGVFRKDIAVWMMNNQ
ncbi:Bromodomain-containing protein [Dioscorea alata]|uniref:Bromodomain-containing protein n=1 Tax=Dioscorea alata TaxID=55571 RepID=A0ACB7WVU9_DIOAL|nr:Bromodomain-containing protein [Dioscorea alata]